MKPLFNQDGEVNVRRKRQFLKLGGYYIRPENIIAVTPYRGSERAAYVFINGIADPIMLDVPATEVIKKIEEHYNS